MIQDLINLKISCYFNWSWNFPFVYRTIIFLLLNITSNQTWWLVLEKKNFGRSLMPNRIVMTTYDNKHKIKIEDFKMDSEWREKITISINKIKQGVKCFTLNTLEVFKRLGRYNQHALSFILSRCNAPKLNNLIYLSLNVTRSILKLINS